MDAANYTEIVPPLSIAPHRREEQPRQSKPTATDRAQTAP